MHSGPCIYFKRKKETVVKENEMYSRSLAFNSRAEKFTIRASFDISSVWFPVVPMGDPLCTTTCEAPVL